MENIQQHPRSAKTNIRTMTKSAVLGAIAAVLMAFSFPVWFAPGFYKLDLSEVVVLVGGFAMGPLAAAAIELVKNLVNLLINGTTTAGVGEVANFLMGCSFVMPAALIYQRKKTVKTAAIGLVVGTFILICTAMLLNYYLLLPVYSAAFHMPMEKLVAMATAVNPAITDLWGFIFLAVAPFNLLKGLVSGVCCLLIYKRVSPILHK